MACNRLHTSPNQGNDSEGNFNPILGINLEGSRSQAILNAVQLKNNLDINGAKESSKAKSYTEGSSQDCDFKNLNSHEMGQLY